MKRMSYGSLLTGVLVAMAYGCVVEHQEAPAPRATTSSALAASDQSILDEPIEIGYLVFSCGKVNMHYDWTAWVPDADCTSGCDVDPVEYCRKFYPFTNYAERDVGWMMTGWVQQGCVPAAEANWADFWVCLM